MKTLQSQTLEKLEGCLDKLPKSWSYGPKERTLYHREFKVVPVKHPIFKPTEEKKEEIENNAQRLIHEYFSRVHGERPPYNPSPSIIASYALFVACDMSGMHMTRTQAAAIAGRGPASFRRLERRLMKKSGDREPIIKKDPETDRYYFVEVEEQCPEGLTGGSKQCY